MLFSQFFATYSKNLPFVTIPIFLFLVFTLIIKADRRISFRSTTRNVFLINGDHLECFHAFRATESSLCAKGCLDIEERVGRNLQRFTKEEDFCGCFFSHVRRLLHFSDAPPDADVLITYHCNLNLACYVV